MGPAGMSGARDWPEVTIHPSQHPSCLAEQLARALSSRRLPAKFHYLTPQQARRWLRVHAAYAPSGGMLGATTAAYGRLFEDLAQRLAPRPVQVIGLGCGGGQKDALLAKALARAGCALRYLAVDVGLALVLMAADAVASAAPGCKVRRLVADLDELDDWRGFLEQGSERGELQLFCAFGITPNTDADRLLERLAGQSSAGDHLLLSANLYDPGDPLHFLEAILPQYDNAETRRWLTTFFADLDWPVTPEELLFDLREQESPARIAATLTLMQPFEAAIGSVTIAVPQGTCLDVFSSNRFRPGDLTGLLERHGFDPGAHRETATAAEAVWHAERRSQQ